MGFIFSKIMDAFSAFGTTKAKIMLIGLDAAGKTTVLYKLMGHEKVVTIPTMGFNVETLSPVDNVTFTAWDVGGGDKIRPLWRCYLAGSDGLMFVVDSCDVERIEEARELLLFMLTDDAMMDGHMSSSIGQSLNNGEPIVIMANKQDLPNAMKTDELVDKLGLRELKANPWHVQEVCATSGDGLLEAVTKMAEMVTQFKQNGGISTET